MQQNLIDEKSTLVQVMAWCSQERNHYLSRCWPRSLSPYGITKPQWVKIIPQASQHFEGCTKWLTFWRLYFQMHFVEWFHWRLFQSPQGTISDRPALVLDNGYKPLLEPMMAHQCIYASLCLKELLLRIEALLVISTVHENLKIRQFIY